MVIIEKHNIKPNHQNGYIEQAGDKYKHFDMGDDWNRLTDKNGPYAMENTEVFDAFNRPFIQEGIDKKSTI